MSKICLYILSSISFSLAQSDLTKTVGEAVVNEPSNVKWWIIVVLIVGVAFFLRML